MIKIFVAIQRYISRDILPKVQCRQLKQIAEAIYDALPQTPLLFLSQTLPLSSE